MALETTTYQCPNCNGRLSFDSGIGMLRCEFCESSFSVEEVERLYAEKQAKADAKAADGRARKAAEQAGIDVGSLGDLQLREMERAYEQAVSEGKSQQEIQQILQGIAASGSAAAATVSAAGASTSEAAHVKPAPVELTGDPIKDYIAQSKWSRAETDDLRAFNCPACGAQLLVDQVTAVTSCPYCGNNAVVPGQLSDILKPDYVIPFKLDRAAAIAALKNYYNGKKLLPDDFTANNHIEEIQGVYVPFWLYTGSAESDVTFDATNTRTWSDKDNIYTDIDHFDLHRVGSMDYQFVPVDGSTKMPDAHMDAIEPFDYSEMVPFSVAYLPGYVTDRYDLDVEQCDRRARNRVENTCVEEMRETATGYMEVNVSHSHTDVQWNTISYALLPVWMLHTKWNGEDYLFAMNGQTGKFIGDLPIDSGKSFKQFLITFVPLLVILAAIVFFVFGF